MRRKGGSFWHSPSGDGLRLALVKQTVLPLQIAKSGAIPIF